MWSFLEDCEYKGVKQIRIEYDTIDKRYYEKHIYKYEKQMRCPKCGIDTIDKDYRNKTIKDIQNGKRVDYYIEFFTQLCPVCKKVYSPFADTNRGITDKLSNWIAKKYLFEEKTTKTDMSKEFGISVPVISEIIDDYMDKRFPDRDDRIEKMYLPIQYIRSRKTYNCYIICQFIRDENKIKIYDLVQDLPDNAQPIPESKKTKEWQQKTLNLINSHSCKNFRELRFLFLIACQYVKI